MSYYSIIMSDLAGCYEHMYSNFYCVMYFHCMTSTCVRLLCMHVHRSYDPITYITNIMFHLYIALNGMPDVTKIAAYGYSNNYVEHPCAEYYW